MVPWQLIIPAIVLSALVVAGVLAVAARNSRRLRPWLLVAVVGVAAMPVAIVLHNALGALSGGEEGISFVVALTVAPLCIAAGLIGSAIVLLRERRDLGIGVSLAACGIGLFALYTLFALVVTTIEGTNPDYQAPIETVVVPLAALAAVAGALVSLFAITRVGHPATA